MVAEYMGPKFTPEMRTLIVGFVEVCHITAASIVTTAHIERVDELLLKTSRLMEQIFGMRQISSTQHLQCHFGDVMRDYGPSPAFNLFAMERMNGYLGKICRNVGSVEVSVMRHLSRISALNLVSARRGGYLTLTGRAAALSDDMVGNWVTESGAVAENTSVMRVTGAVDGLTLLTLVKASDGYTGGYEVPAAAATDRKWMPHYIGCERGPVPVDVIPISGLVESFGKRSVIDRDLRAYFMELIGDADEDSEDGVPQRVRMLASVIVTGQTIVPCSGRTHRPARCLVTHGPGGLRTIYSRDGKCHDDLHPALVRKLFQVDERPPTFI